MKFALILMLCCVLLIVIVPIASSKERFRGAFYNSHIPGSIEDDNLDEMRSLQQGLERLRS
uniref:Uncharacterized protein n=1 Tax=Ciona intestinalis TaxID=7719 RepID=H2XU08_CIOIN